MRIQDDITWDTRVNQILQACMFDDIAKCDSVLCALADISEPLTSLFIFHRNSRESILSTKYMLVVI